MSLRREALVLPSRSWHGEHLLLCSELHPPGFGASADRLDSQGLPAAAWGFGGREQLMQPSQRKKWVDEAWQQCTPSPIPLRGTALCSGAI